MDNSISFIKMYNIIVLNMLKNTLEAQNFSRNKQQKEMIYLNTSPLYTLQKLLKFQNLYLLQVTLKNQKTVKYIMNQKKKQNIYTLTTIQQILFTYYLLLLVSLLDLFLLIPIQLSSALQVLKLYLVGVVILGPMVGNLILIKLQTGFLLYSLVYLLTGGIENIIYITCLLMYMVKMKIFNILTVELCSDFYTQNGTLILQCLIIKALECYLQYYTLYSISNKIYQFSYQLNIVLVCTLLLFQQVTTKMKKLSKENTGQVSQNTNQLHLEIMTMMVGSGPHIWEECNINQYITYSLKFLSTTYLKLNKLCQKNYLNITQLLKQILLCDLQIKNQNF